MSDRRDHLMNEMYNRSFLSRHHSNHRSSVDYELDKLSKSSNMLNTSDNRSDNRIKNLKTIHKPSGLSFDIPMNRINKNLNDYSISKSVHNLSTTSHLNDKLNRINKIDSLKHPNHNISIKNLITRLYQMEEQINIQSSKLLKFEQKIDELNRENDELTQELQDNRRKAANEIKNYLFVREELNAMKERLESQLLLNSRLESENMKLSERAQSNQIKLTEKDDKYEHLIQIKNRDLDEHKLKIEYLNGEINRKSDEIKQLEMDKQNLRKKISILNQVTDKQDEKIEQQNLRSNQLEQEIENLKKQINFKELENDKSRKELILTRNSLKKIQNLNQTNENLIIWLNKQLTDSQIKFDTLYPKPFKKSESINLNHSRPLDYETNNLSETLSDSHILNNKFKLDDLRNELRTDSRTDYKNDFRREYRNDFKDESIKDFRTNFKSEFRTDHANDAKLDYRYELRNEMKSNKPFVRNYTQMNRPINSIRRLEPENYRLNDLKSNLLYANKRFVDDIESFQCTIGK